MAASLDDVQTRLNWFNGQRLAAADLRDEQAYHLGMRRLLNRSLYSPGIVIGLEVTPDPASRHRVMVAHGLAFDDQGREILVPEDIPVPVMGTPSSGKGVVYGNLLVVSYRESRRQVVAEGCAAGVLGAPCAGDLAWGAPTRIAGEPVFEVLDTWPDAASGKVVLAQLELSKTCEVTRVLPGVRKYATPARPQQVRPLSIEGEKDLDGGNPKKLYFHIEGGFPDTVSLYLRGGRFSTLFYTEMGSHTHVVTLPDLHVDIGHTHPFQGTPMTKTDGEHRHSFYWDNGNPGAFDMNEDDTSKWVLKNETDTLSNPFVVSGAHQHELETLVLQPLVQTVVVPVTGSNAVAGADMDARDGKPALKEFKDLVIFLDEQPVTDQVCKQLDARDASPGKWGVLVGGDVRMKGSELKKGTGRIDLLKLGIEIGLGEHSLEFRVSDPDVGGNLQFNLYAG